MSFATPATPSGGLDFKELNGALLLIDVTSVEDHVPTVHTKPGEKSPAVRGDVIILDGPKGGEKHEDTLIFPKVLQSQLKARVGQKVLGRLGQGIAKPGQSAPWQLAEATPEEIAVAEAWVAANTEQAVVGAKPPF